MIDREPEERDDDRMAPPWPNPFILFVLFCLGLALIFGVASAAGCFGPAPLDIDPGGPDVEGR